jgi:hypothetical protein
MATKKTADLTGLVATKGSAAPVADMPPRSIKPAPGDTDEANNEPLNFRVTAEFRRRFRMFAAAHDLKLNELLRRAFDEYEQRHSN